MTLTELRAMSDEELKELAKQKGRKGNASTAARRAQEELLRRNGGAIGVCHYGGSYFLSDEYHGRFTKRFK